MNPFFILAVAILLILAVVAHPWFALLALAGGIYWAKRRFDM